MFKGSGAYLGSFIGMTIFELTAFLCVGLMVLTMIFGSWS